jgi:CBS domain-containing protein
MVCDAPLDNVFVVPHCKIKPLGSSWYPSVVNDFAKFNAALVHAVPLDVNTLPDVPGATELIPDVPLPINTALAANVERPVPPSATAKSVIPVIEPPVIVALPKTEVVEVIELTVILDGI